MYELKKYLNIDRNTLQVNEAHSLGNFPKLPIDTPHIQIYRVVHFKPFEFSDDNIKKFLKILFQDILVPKNLKFHGTSLTREKEISSREVSITISGIGFSIIFHRNSNGASVTIESDTFCEFINLDQNKNNFTILKRVKKEVDSFTDWDFLKDKMEEKLLNRFGKKLTVNGYIRDTDEGESGQFKIILHTDLICKHKLKSVSFTLENKELKVMNILDNVKTKSFNMSKDANYYRKVSKDYLVLADSIDEIESIVHWVIFSSRRERRLKQLLDDKEIV